MRREYEEEKEKVIVIYRLMPLFFNQQTHGYVGWIGFK